MSKTRQQRAGEQSNIDSFMRKDPPSEDPPFTNKEIKQMFANLEKHQSSIKSSIDNKNKDEDSRLNKNEKMVEAINDNVNRITESIDKIIPRLGVIEARLTSVEERLDAATDLERNIECLEDVEQALPRIGTIEDRLTEIEEQLNDRVRLQKRVEDLEEQALWEELERKKQNLVVYGLEGSESSEETLGVTKTFMREKLKLDPKWVEEVQLKAAMRLQGNGKGPLPIRITFMWPKDRDTCLRAGPSLKGTNLSLRTDLPRAMRVERAKLASDGYARKKRGEVIKTRIREKGITLWLEVNEKEGEKWKPIKKDT